MGALDVRVRPAAPATRWREVFSAYLALTKPGIISLLLITTLPTMILAQRGIPSPWLMFATVLGGTLAAGGANAINCYVDRDIDEIMHRTRGRPLPMGKVDPASALVFALALEVAAFVLLALAANLLAALLAFAAAAFYVLVYTMWLKRTTPQNIVVGGAAGAMPPLVAWAAVRGDVGWPAVVLFAIIFFWTPPHFWALSIKYRDDYARAGVPMLPVVASLHETKKQIFLYAALLLPVSLALYATGTVGWLYLVAAAALGGVFVWKAWRLRGDDRPGAAMRVFTFSLLYLALIFVAVGVDPLILR
ncbi:MAG: heme o synthase [Chloroflexota bacterium]|nr:heme o synthase [Chloroflexota bacterium]